MVGVVASFAVWSAEHVLFLQTTPVRTFRMAFDAPVSGSLDSWALALAVLAGVALFRLKLGVTGTPAIRSAASVVAHLGLDVTA